MKRRDFLKTPALSAFVAGAPAYGILRHRWGNEDPDVRVEESKVDQRMHPDFKTYVDGIEYFYFGNGEIMGAVQHSPSDPQTSFFGFTLMNPSKFSRKWSTYLYHPERGLGASRLSILVDDSGAFSARKSGIVVPRGYSVLPDNLKSMQWKYVDRVPMISVAWTAGPCLVEEEFFAPSEGALIFRRIRMKNTSDRDINVVTSLLLYANFGIFDRIFTDEKARTANALGIAEMKLMALDKDSGVYGRYEVKVDAGRIGPGEEKTATYVYAVDGAEALLRKKGFDGLWDATARYWKEKMDATTGDPTIDHLLRVSTTGLRAVLAKDCRMDAGIWMYNMEWVIDHMLAAVGLLRSGFTEEAKAVVSRALQTGIAPDGRTIESSRTFGYDYTELNQNGTLGYAVWEYYCWTGDLALIRKHWERIKTCVELPLKDLFLDPVAKMVKNKREFWERSDLHGIEEGFEMAYQFWVSFGLEKSAELAELLGERSTAAGWRRHAAEIKTAMLSDPRFKLIEDGHFIKRRTAGGNWQQFAIPPDRGKLPAGSPIATVPQPALDPDTVEAFPIVYEFIDPSGTLAQKTLDWIDTIWSQQWEGGGYPRYNATSDDNPAAPWPLASAMVARAHAEAGHDDKVWRVLKWLGSVPGANGGSWFERLGQSITPPMPPVGVVGWIWYELIALFVQHIAGVRPQTNHLLIRPRLLQGLDSLTTTHRVRGTNVRLEVRKQGEESYALVNGKRMPLQEGKLRLPYSRSKSLNIEITMKRS